MLRNYNRKKTTYEIIFKPLFDYTFAFLILFITWPLILIAIIFIKIDSKGPVFFTQNRIGKNCEEFKIYKLRTLKTETHDEEGRKLFDRERVTRVGKIIRKFSIDELPQLINILKADMSFIGPRPLLIRYLPYYSEEELRRHDVKMGITGLAQINGRSYLQWEERFEYDVYYVDNLTFKMDFMIFIKTISAVFSGKGSSTKRPEYMVDFDEHRNYVKLR